MNFVYKKECNLEEGKVYYGIVRESDYLPFGVYPMMVDEINYSDEVAIFEYTERKFIYFSGVFCKIGEFVYETREEAKEAIKGFNASQGLSISVLG